MNRSNILSLALLYLLFTSLPAGMLAQGTVTIYGTVTDPTGAAISGANLKATNEATGRSRDTLSGADGSYTIPDLTLGSYRLTAQAAGFKTFLQQAIHLQVDENRRVPIQLALGAVSENVTVEADVTQVETRTSALKEVVD
jgi:Carboxypeptidase regulatory-like domain